MSKSKNTPFTGIDHMQLLKVAGGAARVTARGGDSSEITTALQTVMTSIKDLAGSKNSGGDPMQMMMMMMMMGGGGGGGGGAAPAAAAPPPTPPVINISTSVRR
ncbi:MAG: hypothetical protein WKG01_12725 [Kofleriaceae bacterium]